MKKNYFDLIIVGAGPAGLSASIYASRYKINHLLLSASAGGYLREIHNIENYPGFRSIKGIELAEKMIYHAQNLGARIVNESVKNISKGDDLFGVKTADNLYQSRFVILTLGTKQRELGIPGEKEFVGRGVSYCATCDAPFFKGKTVAVIGGANSAAMAALLLAKHANLVYIIYRGESLKADPSYLDQINSEKKIQLIMNTNVSSVIGDQSVKALILDRSINGKSELSVDGVFVEIGSEPRKDIISRLGIDTDEQGYIRVGPDQSTNIEGIFAAGDCTTGSNKMRQIITAAAEGAIAAGSVFKKMQASKIR